MISFQQIQLRKTTLITILLFSLFLSGCMRKRYQLDPSLDYEPLKKALLQIDERTYRYRLMLGPIIKNHGLKSKEFEEVIGKMVKQDSLNLVDLHLLEKKYGWPTISKVGEECANIAFVVIQHSDDIPKYYPLIKKVHQKGEISDQCYALITDRLLVTKRKKQLYGTQSNNVNGSQRIAVYPISNFKEVDKRRKLLGMGTLEEYLRSTGYVYDSTLTMKDFFPKKSK